MYFYYVIFLYIITLQTFSIAAKEIIKHKVQFCLILKPILASAKGGWSRGKGAMR